MILIRMIFNNPTHKFPIFHLIFNINIHPQLPQINLRHFLEITEIIFNQLLNVMFQRLEIEFGRKQSSDGHGTSLVRTCQYLILNEYGNALVL